MSFQVSGNAADAHGLSRSIRSEASEICENTKKLAAASNRVKSAWKDRGNASLDEIVSDLVKALSQSAEGVNKTCQVLDAYAKFLENK